MVGIPAIEPYSMPAPADLPENVAHWVADPARAVVHDGAHDRWCVHRERAAGDESTDSERELKNTAAAVFGYSNRVAQSGWHNVHRMKTNATSARK